MDVLIYVNYQGKEYCWDDLSKSQQKEFTEKLNQQTANQLGYVKSNQEEKMIKADGAKRKLSNMIAENFLKSLME